MTNEKLEDKMERILTTVVPAERIGPVMFQLFAEVEEWGESERQAAWDDGYDDGVAEAEANASSYDEGHRDGYSEGYSYGYDEGRNNSCNQDFGH